MSSLIYQNVIFKNTNPNPNKKTENLKTEIKRQ